MHTYVAWSALVLVFIDVAMPIIDAHASADQTMVAAASHSALAKLEHCSSTRDLRNMVLKHESEAKLLQASKQYDAALKEQDLDKLDNLVDSNYIIHADGITLHVRPHGSCCVDTV